MLLAVDGMKSQASFEFMILIVFLIAMSVSIILAFQSQFSTLGLSGQIRLEDVCANVAEKINTAYEYGVGYEQNITLPADLDSKNYTITVTNQTVVCILEDLASIENLLTNDVKNATSNQPFSIPIGEIKISNVNGVIVVS